MRTLTAPQQAALLSAERTTHLRVRIAGVDLSTYVGMNWIHGVTFGASLDQPIAEARIQLQRSAGGPNISPLISSLLNGAQETFVDVATLAAGGLPGAGDWETVFHGWLDTESFARNPMELVARDIGGELVDRFIEEETIYGTDIGRPVELVMQDILDDWLPGTVLLVPTVPGFVITEYRQTRQPIFAALRTLAALFGWDVRPTWNGTGYQIALIQPDRTKSVTDWTFGADRYHDVTRLEIDRTFIRNAITIEYPDSGTGEREEVTRESGASQLAYKRLWMRIEEPEDSPIDTAAEANAFADAALADLASPVADQEIETQFFWPIELGDLYRFTGNGKHYQADQDLAAVAYRHELIEGRRRTFIQTRGKPAGFFLDWHRIARERARGAGGNPVSAFLRAIVDSSGAAPVVDVTLEVRALSGLLPVTGEVYVDQPGGAPLVIHSFTLSGETITKGEYPVLGGFTLPLHSARRWFARIVPAAGVPFWVTAIADRDKIPGGVVVADDFRATPALRCSWDDDVEEIEISTPIGPKTFVIDQGTSPNPVIYTIGDQVDGGAIEAAFGAQETRGPYSVVYRGAATEIGMWNGDLHGLLAGKRDAWSLGVTLRQKPAGKVDLVIDGGLLFPTVYYTASTVAPDTDLLNAIGPFFAVGGFAAELPVTLGNGQTVHVVAWGNRALQVTDPPGDFSSPVIRSLTYRAAGVPQILNLHQIVEPAPPPGSGIEIGPAGVMTQFGSASVEGEVFDPAAAGGLLEVWVNRSTDEAPDFAAAPDGTAGTPAVTNIPFGPSTGFDLPGGGTAEVLNAFSVSPNYGKTIRVRYTAASGAVAQEDLRVYGNYLGIDNDTGLIDPAYPWVDGRFGEDIRGSLSKMFDAVAQAQQMLTEFDSREGHAGLPGERFITAPLFDATGLIKLIDTEFQKIFSVTLDSDVTDVAGRSVSRMFAKPSPASPDTLDSVADGSSWKKLIGVGVSNQIVSDIALGNSLFANSAVVDRLFAQNVFSAAVFAKVVVAGAILGDKIAANQIVGGHIAAATITSDKLSVAQLAAIVADLGVVSAGILNNAPVNPIAGMRLSAAYAKPGTWARYIDWAATGANPVIQVPGFTARANGTSEFSGEVKSNLFTGSNIVLNQGYFEVTGPNGRSLVITEGAIFTEMRITADFELYLTGTEVRLDTNIVRFQGVTTTPGRAALDEYMQINVNGANRYVRLYS